MSCPTQAEASSQGILAASGLWVLQAHPLCQQPTTYTSTLGDLRLTPPKPPNKTQWSRLHKMHTLNQDPKSRTGLGGFVDPCNAFACIHGSALYVPSTPTIPTGPLHSVSRAVFICSCYMQSTNCTAYIAPEVGLSVLVNRAFRVLPCRCVFSSLQDRSNSVHLPCQSARSDGNPRSTFRPSTSPLTLPI